VTRRPEHAETIAFCRGRGIPVITIGINILPRAADEALVEQSCASPETRSLRVGRSESGPDDGIRNLPFLPASFEIIPRLLLLISDPEMDGEALAELIRVDAGLTADVLRVSNSAAYGGALRTETLVQAIARLGLREVSRVVTMVVTSPVLSNSQQVGFASVDLWQHSLASAIATQTLAENAGLDGEVAFTTGLLHDIGKTVLAQAFGEEYIQTIHRCKSENVAFWEAERTVLQTNHADIGGRLLKHWNFPDEIVAGVGWHHDLAMCPRPYRKMTAAVHLGNVLAYRMNHGYGFPDYVVEADILSLRQLGFERRELQGFQEQARDRLRSEQDRFRRTRSGSGARRVGSI
jgi:putative nucleotidyltransferase with HDIG domain